jgi:hypothetical protein
MRVSFHWYHLLTTLRHVFYATLGVNTYFMIASLDPALKAGACGKRSGKNPKRSHFRHSGESRDPVISNTSGFLIGPAPDLIRGPE